MSLRLRALFLTCLGLLALTVHAADQTYVLRKLILADKAEELGKIPDDAGGDTPLFVQGVPIFSGSDAKAAVAPFIGKPISVAQLNDIGTVLKALANKHDRVVDIVVPSQNVTNGVVRFAVAVAHYGQVEIRGNKYFSRKVLEQNLGIKAGDEVRLSTLEDAVNWTNSNPFRRVQVLVNSITTQPGRSDLIVGVAEAWPYRLAASYDDSGVSVIGRNHYTAAVQFGNLWGLDHQGSYQFTTTDNIKTFQSHSLSYTIPLPWRHNIEFDASYGTMKPDLGNLPFDQTGKNIGASFRYRIPVGSGNRTGQFFAGVDFQESNNALEYGVLQILGKVDIFQAVTGFTAVLKDKRGGWLLGGTLNLSPGDINSRNTDEAFQPDTRADHYHFGTAFAKAEYATAILSIQRELDLNHGWQFTSRGFAQLATGRMVGNEQLAIGGANTVRGYDTNILSGDEGFVFSNELLAPVWNTPMPLLKKKNAPLQTRFLLFYDVGHVFNRFPIPVADVTTGQRVGWDDTQLRRPIASTGIGLRMTFSSNFSLNFDYGWHTTHMPQYAGQAQVYDPHGRGHIKVVFAY